MTAQIERLSAKLQRFVSALETVGLTKELLLSTLSSSSRRNPQSLLGKISKLVHGNNRQTNRDKLYYKWVRNTLNIQSITQNSLASATPVIADQLHCPTNFHTSSASQVNRVSCMLWTTQIPNLKSDLLHHVTV